MVKHKSVSTSDKTLNNNKTTKNKKIPWTSEEDTMLIKLYKEKEKLNLPWNFISAMFNRKLPENNRTERQCKFRLINKILPKCKFKKWTSKEEDALFKAHIYLGMDFAKIAKLITGRTRFDVERHFLFKLKSFIEKLIKDIKRQKLLKGWNIDEYYYSAEYLMKMVIKNKIELHKLDQEYLARFILEDNEKRNQKEIEVKERIQKEKCNKLNEFLIDDNQKRPNIKGNQMKITDFIINKNNIKKSNIFEILHSQKEEIPLKMEKTKKFMLNKTPIKENSIKLIRFERLNSNYMDNIDNSDINIKEENISTIQYKDNYSSEEKSFNFILDNYIIENRVSLINNSNDTLFPNKTITNQETQNKSIIRYEYIRKAKSYIILNNNFKTPKSIL